MPLTKTNEMAFNVHLFNVLRTKHPRWRDHAGVEQTGVFRDAALQPDLVIHPPGGVPVIIETEFEPARSVEQDARVRLGQRLQYNGDLIEQTIAVKVPKDLRRVQQSDLSQHIEAAEFHYCTYSGQKEGSSVRWPAEGWLVGSVDDDEWTFPLILWANTTLGLIAFWWIGARQQQGRANLTITQLPGLTVLDPRTLSSEQIAQAEDIFSDFKNRTFLPANEAYRDNTRQALDCAVLVNLLQLPKDALEPLAILRDQWCAEPSVHGGKKTRIGV